MGSRGARKAMMNIRVAYREAGGTDAVGVVERVRVIDVSECRYIAVLQEKILIQIALEVFEHLSFRS